MSAESVYDLGDDVKVQAAFSVDGENVDPSDLVLQILAPGETVETIQGVQLTNEGIGVYSYVVNASIEGRWRYRFVASGNVNGAEENSFYVRSTVFND